MKELERACRIWELIDALDKAGATMAQLDNDAPAMRAWAEELARLLTEVEGR